MSDTPPSAESIDDRLAQLAQDPLTAMDAAPPRRVLQDGPGPLPLESLRAGNAFVERRDSVRSKLRGIRDDRLIRLEQILPGRAPMERNDRPEDLVDRPGELCRKLDAMEARGLRKAKLPQTPWATTYWPIYQGQTGARYAAAGWPTSRDWKEFRAFVDKNPVAAVLAAGRADDLSPAEKYDLLVGDEDFTLTASQWEAGRRYYESSGSVEPWMGLCHGWAPAAFMLPRPTKPVTVLAADGVTKLTFYPSDLKALGCLLWAVNDPAARFIGGRCNDKEPGKDPKNGRTLSKQCFDTNPGTWHMSVVNQIGVAKRSFIIDATFDYEVWNQPVLGYAYGYFDPRTRKSVKTLAEATVARGSWAADPFAAYRSKDATALVGVAMSLTYVAETLPQHEQTDGEGRDRLVAVDYLYDVELDASGQIIGGEWYENKHPDFLWTPPPDGQALAPQDADVTGAWNDDTLPQGWRDAAIAASGSGRPLATIVNSLFNLAR